MDPIELATHVKAGIECNEQYIIPYPDAAAPLKAHFEEVVEALPAEATDPERVAKRSGRAPRPAVSAGRWDARRRSPPRPQLRR
jgi:hypothetical protein